MKYENPEEATPTYDVTSLPQVITNKYHQTSDEIRQVKGKYQQVDKNYNQVKYSRDSTRVPKLRGKYHSKISQSKYHDDSQQPQVVHHVDVASQNPQVDQNKYDYVDVTETTEITHHPNIELVQGKYRHVDDINHDTQGIVQGKYHHEGAQVTYHPATDVTLQDTQNKYLPVDNVNHHTQVTSGSYPDKHNSQGTYQSVDAPHSELTQAIYHTNSDVTGNTQVDQGKYHQADDVNSQVPQVVYPSTADVNTHPQVSQGDYHTSYEVSHHPQGTQSEYQGDITLNPQVTQGTFDVNQPSQVVQGHHYSDVAPQIVQDNYSPVTIPPEVGKYHVTSDGTNFGGSSTSSEDITGKYQLVESPPSKTKPSSSKNRLKKRRPNYKPIRKQKYFLVEKEVEPKYKKRNPKKVKLSQGFKATSYDFPSKPNYQFTNFAPQTFAQTAFPYFDTFFTDIHTMDELSHYMKQSYPNEEAFTNPKFKTKIEAPRYTGKLDSQPKFVQYRIIRQPTKYHPQTREEPTDSNFRHPDLSTFDFHTQMPNMREEYDSTFDNFVNQHYRPFQTSKISINVGNVDPYNPSTDQFHSLDSPLLQSNTNFDYIQHNSPQIVSESNSDQFQPAYNTQLEASANPDQFHHSSSSHLEPTPNYPENGHQSDPNTAHYYPENGHHADPNTKSNHFDNLNSQHVQSNPNLDQYNPISDSPLDSNSNLNSNTEETSKENISIQNQNVELLKIVKNKRKFRFPKRKPNHKLTGYSKFVTADLNVSYNHETPDNTKTASTDVSTASSSQEGTQSASSTTQQENQISTNLQTQEPQNLRTRCTNAHTVENHNTASHENNA